MNFHRPCAVPKVLTAANGKRRRVYLRWATPFELFRESPGCENYLRPRRHVGGTGALRPEPIRYRSRAGHAARQTQALPQLLHRNGSHDPLPPAPPVGRRSACARVKCTAKAKATKTKTFLRRKNQDQLAGSRASRWSAPGAQKLIRKEPQLPTPSRRLSGSSFDENMLGTIVCAAFGANPTTTSG